MEREMKLLTREKLQPWKQRENENRGGKKGC